MKNLKKIFALAMILAMVLSLAVPAMAADTYSITVNNSGAVVKHQYQVYQIFVGTIDTTTASTEGNHILSDVQWGTGIKGSDLYAELIGNAGASEKYPTFYEKYVAALAAGNANVSDHFEELGEAGQIAKVLGDNSNNAALVTEFARAAGEYLTDVCEMLETTDNKTYTKDGFAAGYYLVKDADGSLDDANETYTNYILQVVGNTNVNSKGGAVTVDKVIVDGIQDVETADYSVGDHVEFNIYGTLPDNYAKFVNFEYEFVDTMSKGLTYDAGSLKVYLENAGVATELPATSTVTTDAGDTVVTNYTVSAVTNATTGVTTLSVDFPDLKSIPNRTIDAHTSIIVEYTATLNENAVIGGNGNKNSVKIVFNNDPYSDGEGETPEDHVFVFTFELDVTKVDGSKTDADGNHLPLANAKFVLFRRRMGADEYAVLNSDGKVTDWTPFKNQAAIDAYATENSLTAEEKAKLVPATEIVSGPDGLGKIIGLESDIYHLEEVAAPAGYNILTEVIDLDIEAIVSETDDNGNVVTNGLGTSAKIVTLTIKVGNGNVENGNTATGIVDMEVINNPGALLPETGGTGTTLFYVFGGLMVCAAVVLLVTKRRMSV